MFVSHHTLKWTRTCRSHGRHPHAHTAHFLLNRHKAVPRGQAVRLSRAGTAEGRSGGAHHEPAGGRRQLGRQGRIAQPSRAARGAHAPRVRMGMLHEDRAPTTGVIHPRRLRKGEKATTPEPDDSVAPHTGPASTGTNSTPPRDTPTPPTDNENQSKAPQSSYRPDSSEWHFFECLV